MSASNINSVSSPQPDEAEALLLVARRVALVAGAFAIVVAVLLLVDYQRRSVKDPLESPAFKALKEKLAADPKNEALKVRIRHTDLDLRTQYFRQRAFTGVGGLMLLASTIVCLLAARAALTLNRRLPTPPVGAAPSDPEIAAKRIARRSVAGMTAALIAAALLLLFTVRTPLAGVVVSGQGSEGGGQGSVVGGQKPVAQEEKQEKEEPTEKPEMEKPAPAPTVVASAESPASAAPAANSLAVSPALAASPAATASPATPITAPPPSDDVIAQNWPQFRGPAGRAIAAGGNYPTAWDAASGKGIVWKTPVGLPGNNTPVLWGDKLFYSGADEKTRKVFCIDTGSGKTVWETAIGPGPQSPPGVPKVEGDTGLAAPTMATDGRRAFAIFPNGDVVALDYAGHILWIRSLGMPENHYGHATSLATYKGLVLVQFDQGEGKDSHSKLYGLDMATGKVAWQTSRPVPNGWSSPMVVRTAGRDQFITTGDPWVIAYDPADGKELWRADVLKQEIGPSPAFALGMVFAVNQAPALVAIRADGQGNVTKSHVAWIGEDNLPDICSPLATDAAVYLLTSEGELTAYETKSGKKLWEKDTDTHFKASPAMAGKYLYLLDDGGKCLIVEPGPKEAKDISKGTIGEPCTASPIFHNGRIYLRGGKNLYCVGAK